MPSRRASAFHHRGRHVDAERPRAASPTHTQPLGRCRGRNAAPTIASRQRLLLLCKGGGLAHLVAHAHAAESDDTQLFAPAPNSCPLLEQERACSKAAWRATLGRNTFVLRPIGRCLNPAAARSSRRAGPVAQMVQGDRRTAAPWLIPASVRADPSAGTHSRRWALLRVTALLRFARSSTRGRLRRAVRGRRRTARR
jgi:hypothetical protein